MELPSTLHGNARGGHPRELSEVALVALVLGITLLAYLRAATFDFVYDDRGQILENPFIQSWQYFPQYFISHVWGNIYPGVHGNYYRPFFLLWSLLNHSVFGFWPVGWHLSAILLHLMATALTFAVVRRLSADRITAAIASLVFGVHPVHLEAVAWVSGAPELLCYDFFLGAFLVFLNFRKNRTGLRLGMACVLYSAALLSKETALIFPLCVFAFVWASEVPGDSPGHARPHSRLIAAFGAAAPFVAIAGVYAVMRLAVLQGWSHQTVALPFSTLLLTWPLLLCFYLRLLVFPVGLSAFYDLPYVTRFSWTGLALPALLLVVVGWMLWLWQRKWKSPGILWATTWMVVPLLPVLNLSVLQPGDFVHDRYLYFSSAGLALLLAVALRRMQSHGPKWFGMSKPVFFATAAVGGVLFVGTVVQSGIWAGNLALYSQGLKTAPHNPTVRNNLADELTRRGRWQEAKSLCEEVLREQPDFWLATYNLGYIGYRTGNLQVAEKYLLRATQINPADPDGYAYLGLTRFKLGRLSEAAAGLRQAIQRNPQAPGYHFALGMVLAQQGDCAGARSAFKVELAINPNNAAARDQLEKSCGPA